MIIDWGAGQDILDLFDPLDVFTTGVEDYAVLGNVVYVDVSDTDTVSDVVTVLLEIISLSVAVSDLAAGVDGVRVEIPLVILVVDGVSAADTAAAAIQMVIRTVDTIGVTDAVAASMPLILLVTDDSTVAEMVSALVPIVINIAETGLTPEEWVQRFIGIIAIVTSDVIPIGERRLALLEGFVDLYFDRAQLLQSTMTDEALVE